MLSYRAGIWDGVAVGTLVWEGVSGNGPKLDKQWYSLRGI